MIEFELDNLPESIEGDKVFSTVDEDGQRFLYSGDVSGDQAYLLEKTESSYEETVKYSVTPVEPKTFNLREGIERQSEAEGKDVTGVGEVRKLLESSGPTRTIEPNTLYKQDDDPRFHVREVVTKYRDQTEGSEHAIGKPPEGSWGE